MTCYTPIRGYYTGKRESGRLGVTLRRAAGQVDRPIDLPCGKCIGCKLDWARHWAVRCWHEAQMHCDSCFVTLTYDDAHLPADGSLNKRDLQLWIKRLRDKIAPVKVRYFAAGEYGEQGLRPHYHVLLFGWRPQDGESVGKDLYRSALLESSWEFGFSSFGAVSEASAAYVARYTAKKSRIADEMIREVDMYTGEIAKLLAPEFVVMSRRPGLGRAWVETYKQEIVCDEVYYGGQIVKPSRYYLNTLSEDDRKHISDARARAASAQADNNDAFRLRDKRMVTEAKLSLKKRGTL